MRTGALSVELRRFQPLTTASRSRLRASFSAPRWTVRGSTAMTATMLFFEGRDRFSGSHQYVSNSMMMLMSSGVRPKRLLPPERLRLRRQTRILLDATTPCVYVLRYR